MGLDGEPIRPIEQNEAALRAGVLEHNLHQHGKQLGGHDLARNDRGGLEEGSDVKHGAAEHGGAQIESAFPSGERGKAFALLSEIFGKLLHEVEVLRSGSPLAVSVVGGFEMKLRQHGPVLGCIEAS